MVDQKTGDLTAVPGSPFATTDGPGLITSDSDGEHVFVLEGKFGQPCTQTRGVLLSENIDRHSGTLSPAERLTLDGFCPQGMAVSPDGKHLYVDMVISALGVPGGCCWGEIQAFEIGEKGRLKEIPGSPFQVAPPLGDLIVHPSGKFLYATGADKDGILVFARDSATGALAPPKTVAARPEEHLAIVPSGAFLIGDNMSNIDQLRVFNIDSTTGSLAPQMPMAMVVPVGISVHPSGKFVAFTRVPDFPISPDILIYRMDGNGTLTQVSGPAPTIGRWPYEVRFDPQGEFVYVVSSQENMVAGFAFDIDSGKLTPIPQSPFKTGDSPASLTIVKPK